MPRQGPLRELSREHHAALVLARDCRRATDANAATLLERIRAHHRDILMVHFDMEENLLAAHAAAIPPEMRRQLQIDHDWLRAWVDAASDNVTAIADYGTRLNAHVRWEERTLWPLLQPLVLDDATDQHEQAD